MRITNIRVERLRWELDPPFNAAWDPRSLAVADPSASEEENARAAVRAIESLTREVRGELPSGLNVTEDLVPVLVEDALSELVMGNTPRMPSAGEVPDILTAAP